MNKLQFACLILFANLWVGFSGETTSLILNEEMTGQYAKNEILYYEIEITDSIYVTEHDLIIEVINEEVNLDDPDILISKV
jgi:hypothetical protein